MKKFEGVGRSYTLKDIMDDVQIEYGIKISYNKAQKAKEHALQMVRDSPVESFSLLPSYVHMLEKKNPRTISHIQTDQRNHFLYCFMALGYSICGFRNSIRPVIVMDETFLKGLYKGTMFIAACKDVNNHIIL